MPRRAVRLARRRVGRRGAILVLLGSIAALYGYALINQPIPSSVGIRLLLQVMPMAGWGWAMLAVGVLAVACAPLRQGADWPGFTGLVLVWTPWSLSYLVSWWLGENPRGWISATIFVALAGVPAVVAGWSEVPRLSRRGAREH